MAAAPFVARAAVNPIADRAASLLSALASSLPKRAPRVPVDEVGTPDARHLFREPQPAQPKRGSRHTGHPDKPSGGIFVRRDAVRAAVRRGVRPSGSPVAATEESPAGLVVFGWGAAGVGLADGDIITRVGGRTPTSVNDVVIAVAGAYKSKSHLVSGRIWRKGQTLAVTVELPLPDKNNAQRNESRDVPDQR